MAAFTKFENFVLALGKEVHNFSSDTLKLALTNSAPTASSDTDFSDISEISAGNGYSSGGMTLDSVTWTQSSGTATLDCSDEVLAASGGAIGPFRYVVLYNDTPSSEELIGYYDLGASQSIADTESRTFGIDASGILTIS